MSLEPRVLAKIDNHLRSELRSRKSTLTARVPVSEAQWAVWKRYCDMVGVSVGGGLALLVDHELASVVEEEVATLTESVKAREATVAQREAELAAREETVAKRERECAFRERQLASWQRALDRRRSHLDSREKAIDVLATTSQTRTPLGSRSRPGRNEACWCSSGKKYKNCHLDSDRTLG